MIGFKRLEGAGDAAERCRDENAQQSNANMGGAVTP